MSRSRARLAADWFAKLRQNAVTQEVEHTDVVDAEATASIAILGSGFPSGTKMLFQQTSAPTGWTKDTTHNNKALRVVSGTASSGGTSSFTTAFAARTTSSTSAGGTVGNHTLTKSQMPAHTHNYVRYINAGRGYSYTQGGFAGFDHIVATTSTGGGGAHNHSFSGSSHSHTLDLAVQYVDLIIATKD